MAEKSAGPLIVGHVITQMCADQRCGKADGWRQEGEMQMKDLIAAFERLGTGGPFQRTRRLTDTACVLGGGVAGLFAARVLTDHFDRVVVIERDTVGNDAGPRVGVPQGKHVHTLLPGGLRWMERWFPGITQQIQAGGGVLADPARTVHYIDSHPQVRAGDHRLLMASRPFLEGNIRRRVLELPNVSVLRARAAGLVYQVEEVAGVWHTSGAGPQVLPAGLVVDAMGRASRLSDWLSDAGYDRPELRGVPCAINYTTALFERDGGPEDPELTCSVARYGPPYPADGVAMAAVSAIEGSRWIMMLAGYDDIRPGRTLDAFRAACAKLPPPFQEAARNAPIGEIATYHQADSRRRDFAGTCHFPGRLVSMGDAVASFNPIYGQGMSSAALHAACLSEFLNSGPDLRKPARGFFELQDIMVDAAWSISAGLDAARLDAMNGTKVPKELSRQRQFLEQILRATLVDKEVCKAFQNVAFMIAHPAILATPALVERVMTANASV